MASLGAINCLANSANTGIQPCFCDPKFFQGAILAPKGTVLPATSIAGFTTALNNLVYAANKSGRAYPIYGFEANKDSSEQKIVQKMANGANHVVREGFNQWMFQFVQGGLTLLQKLRAMNGANYDFFFVDNDPTGQKIFGIAGTAANTLQAIPSTGGYFWAEPWKVNDGTKITNYDVEFVFNSKYVNDLVSFVQMPINFDFSTSLPGLDDVIVTANAVASVVAKHFYVNLLSPLNVDLGALNSTVLGAGVSSAPYWNGAAAATPALPYTITSATWVPSAVTGVPGYFDILVAATNYATPPAASLINLAAANVLAAVGVDLESTAQLSIPSV